MSTLVDYIETFHVTPKNLNIPSKDFLSKLSNLNPVRIGTVQDEVYCDVSRGTKSVRMSQDEFKIQLSDLIKKHVNGFHKITWNK